jgi:hypothetical protein
MAKRRMRRTPRTAAPDNESMTEAMMDQAREASVGAVKIATETARAALAGMQELGKTVADMAAPAARRTVRAAGDATRAAVQTAREPARETTREAARTVRPARRARKRSRRRAA